uniref:Uncharacterized protein n=1 Tax=Aegilops tauschii subsp. strangulata TaxID=200361 RepID=A0A453ALD8_AEGTS
PSPSIAFPSVPRFHTVGAPLTYPKSLRNSHGFAQAHAYYIAPDCPSAVPDSQGLLLKPASSSSSSSSSSCLLWIYPTGGDRPDDWLQRQRQRQLVRIHHGTADGH